MTAPAIAASGVRREVVVRAIAERPGLGVRELAAVTELHENYLRRLLPGLIDDGQVIRREDGGLFGVAEASRDVSLLERCPDCFGCREPCAACVTAAGDPAVAEFVIGPGVEQVRRCGCGRVYGAYRAGRAWCFLMVAPGRRQVMRCVRCGQPLSATTTTDCADSPSPPPVARSSRDTSRTTSRATGEKRGGIPARTRHELDRTAARLRQRFASRPPRRRVPSKQWVWSSERAEGCEHAIRELIAETAQHAEEPARLAKRAARLLALGDELLTHTASSTTSGDAGRACRFCGGPIAAGKRTESEYCKKRCRQAASRQRLRDRAPAAVAAPRESCEWCGGPIPAGKRAETEFCKKRCRQAASRFDLAVRRTASALVDQGPSDTSKPAPADTTRRRPPRREVLSDTSRAMRFAYADPPYPGKAGYYTERAEVDHRALIERLVAEFPDGWALSTSAAALQDVLALCPAGVRVCAWQRSARRTRSRRALSAWEPLIVCGGRELATRATQTLQDALVYRGRWRAYSGALTGMKPPQFAVWMLAQLGARAGDEFVDLYPGSGAVGEAWRRYTAAPATRGTAATVRADHEQSATPRGLRDTSLAAAAAADGAPAGVGAIGVSA